MTSEQTPTGHETAARVATAEHPVPAQLAAYGDLAFLYLRTDRYRDMTLAQARQIIQPPIDHMQYRVFRIDRVPRMALTWAYLSDGAEMRLVLGEVLGAAEWASGPNVWLMDLVAPYGRGTGRVALRWFLDNLPRTKARIRYLKPGACGRPQKLVELTRRPGGRWGARAVAIRT